jgi:hypothetical protein
MSRKPHLTVRQIAEVAVDYEMTSGPMFDVAQRHGVSKASVGRSVTETRRQQRLETRQFDLQKHFADVLIESSEAQLEAVLLLRDLMANPDFIAKLGGRDIAAIVGTLAKENRATFDYVRRTFGDLQHEPTADTDTPDTSAHEF